MVPASMRERYLRLTIPASVRSSCCNRVLDRCPLGHRALNSVASKQTSALLGKALALGEDASGCIWLLRSFFLFLCISTRFINVEQYAKWRRRFPILLIRRPKNASTAGLWISEASINYGLHKLWLDSLSRVPKAALEPRLLCSNCVQGFWVTGQSQA